MFKKGFSFIAILLAFSCTKKDVFETFSTDIIVPQAKCIDGFAGEFPCNDYDLMSQIPLNSFFGEGTTGNDSWGWVDALTGKEYAIMGTNRGTGFVDISDPLNPILMGTLATATTESAWRDIKVYRNFAYIVSEAPGHGMQIFELERLRDITNPPVELSDDGIYNRFGNAHNIIVNEDSGFGYAVGTNTFSGGPHFMDLSNAARPLAVGGYAGNEYTHDAQVITYSGPDTDYTGKEILIASNGERFGNNEVVILDVTNKDNPQLISTIKYSNQGYTHQGWFTEDQRFFILGDELDEIDFGGNSRTIIFDFSDLDNPILHFEYLGSTTAIDHNGYVKDNLFYLANYSAGVRMIDISNIENKSITEVGFFDTYPESDAASSNGVWSVYPYLPSGNIIVSDINRGLFIIRKTGT